MHVLPIEPFMAPSNAGACHPNPPTQHKPLFMNKSIRHITIVPPPLKVPQVPIIPNPLIRLPLQTPPRNLYIYVYILDKTLLAHVIVLRPYEPQDQQVHPCAVEIVGEGV